jgi:G3E family GTPase
MTAYPDPIPVNIITGFLGSGKTTIVQRLLAAPDLGETAVLVNEFGEIGLDHHLYVGLSETTLLMPNGCVCCAIRDDLNTGLRDLFSQMTRGEIPTIRRVIVETSGLADPVPIAYTVLTEPVLRHHFRLGAIVTTVDAVGGPGQLDRYRESVKQVAVADRLIITKSDLAGAGEVAELRRDLQALNAAAPIIDGAAIKIEPEVLFGAAGHLPPVDRGNDGNSGGGGLEHDHSHGIQSISVVHERPLDWTAFGIWMTMLVHRHGDKVLRIKGIINVAGVDLPVLINAVQHVVHAPEHLAAWPQPKDRASRIVFIVDGIDRGALEASLRAFTGLAA